MTTFVREHTLIDRHFDGERRPIARQSVVSISRHFSDYVAKYISKKTKYIFTLHVCRGKRKLSKKFAHPLLTGNLCILLRTNSSISPSPGGSLGLVQPICPQRRPKTPFISFQLSSVGRTHRKFPICYLHHFNIYLVQEEHGNFPLCHLTPLLSLFSVGRTQKVPFTPYAPV